MVTMPLVEKSTEQARPAEGSAGTTRQKLVGNDLRPADEKLAPLTVAPACSSGPFIHGYDCWSASRKPKFLPLFKER